MRGLGRLHLSFPFNFGSLEMLRMSTIDESPSQVVVSTAPGKVLIVGGYLVLEKEFVGCVVSLSSCFQSSVSKPTPQSIPATVHVISKQLNSSWTYQIDTSCSHKGLVPSLVKLAQDTPNVLVECCIQLSLALLRDCDPNRFEEIYQQGLLIHLEADNDFYSQIDKLREQQLPLSISSLKAIPKFHSTDFKLNTLKKSGLGSSAALVTSLVAALLEYFGIIHLSDSDQSNPLSNIPNVDLEKVHRIAQICHCVAQGKVGSGFDVASAVYGTQLYHRFSKERVESIFNVNGNIDLDELKKAISPKFSQWDNKLTSFSLPPGLAIILGDVNEGSNTPNMVRKVMDWKAASGKTGLSLWEDLNVSNINFIRELAQLSCEHDKDPHTYKKYLEECANIICPDSSLEGNNVYSCLGRIRRALNESRRLLKKMGEMAGVEIEPNAQTEFLQACLELPGVICGGVPGAGGYDAIFLIYIKSDPVVQRIEKCWQSREVCPLLAEEQHRGVLVRKITN